MDCAIDASARFLAAAASPRQTRAKSGAVAKQERKSANSRWTLASLEPGVSGTATTGRNADGGRSFLPSGARKEGRPIRRGGRARRTTTCSYRLIGTHYQPFCNLKVPKKLNPLSVDQSRG